MAKYGEQFKLMLVSEYQEGKLGYNMLAKKHGIKSGSTIEKWVKVFEKFLPCLINLRTEKEKNCRRKRNDQRTKVGKRK